MKMTVRWTALAMMLFFGVALAKAETPFESTQCDVLPAGPGCAPVWWFSADALFLHRTQNYSQTLVVDENNAQVPVLTGNNLDFGAAAGPRIAVGRRWDSGITTELVYYGMHDWSSSAQALGNNNLSLPGDLGLATFDFFAADRMDVSYGSRLQNAEANLWAPLGGVEWLAGLRHFSVIEDFQIASFDADTYQSDYQIQTNNQLYGGQIGVRKRWTRGWLGFAPEAKFGLLGNANNQRSLIRDLDNSKVLRDETISSSILSSLSELRLVGDASITKNMRVTMGYNLLWLTGVAQAPYQFDSTFAGNSSQFVDDNHSIFYHGANIGLTWVR